MKRRTLKKYSIWGGILAFVLCVFISLNREKMLVFIGDFLLVENHAEFVDVIVALRGDSNYRRILSAAQYFKDGYSHHIYIPTALNDRSSAWLAKYGVKLPTEQEREQAILVQLGIPDKKILLGWRSPGGGTQGEINRIKAMALDHGCKKAMLVTNWWHTRRTEAICNRIFAGTDIETLVVAARDDISNPSNWWKYRYEGVSVIEEYFKLLIFYSSGFYDPSFVDDPLDT